MQPSLYGNTPIGMFRPSAKVEILRALPSGPMSSRIMTRSRPFPSFAGYGYSMVSLTHNRPRSSKFMFSGLWMSGSLATSCSSNPGGKCSFAFSSEGLSLLVVATCGGSCAASDDSEMEVIANAERTRCMEAPEKRGDQQADGEIILEICFAARHRVYTGGRSELAPGRLHCVRRPA